MTRKVKTRRAAGGSALLCLLCVALAAPALAAPAWLAPIDLSAPGHDATEPQVAVDPAGNAVAVWSRFNGSHTIIQAAVRPAGSGWESPKDLSAVGRNATEPQVAVDSAGNAVAVWSRFNGSHTIIQSAVRPAGGGWSAVTDLSATGRNATEPQVAVDPAGNAVAIWRRFNGVNYIVQAATRPAGGAWDTAIDLSALGQNAEAPQVAVDSAGNAVAVWSRSDGANYIVQATTRPAGGPWAEPVDLSAVGGSATEPQVAVDPAGNAVAVWSRFDGSTTIIQSAARPAGGVWLSPDDLSAEGSDAIEPAVAVDPAGNAVAVWSRSASAPYTVIEASTRAAGGSWLQPVELSVQGKLETPQVAVDPAGTAIAVWAQSSGAPTVIESASRPAGGGWTPAKNLSVIGNSATEPQLALDPAGDGAAVWSRENGANAIVQAAGHDAAAPQLRTVSVPAVGTVRQPVAFTAVPFDVWSAIGSIGWSFGDGAGGDGAAAEHAFARPGVYLVTVTVLDALGNSASASAEITIFRGAYAGRNVRVRHGRALLRLRCPSPAGCEGEVRLIAAATLERNGRRFSRRVRIGRTPFSIPGPSTATVAVKLTKTGRKLVRAAGTKGLRTQLTGPGVRHRLVLLFGPPGASRRGQ